jgi:8-amino-7-oxononanoate synthase
MRGEEWMGEHVSALKARGLERKARVFPQAAGRFEMDGRTVLNFSSNDYLNLASHPVVVERARRALDQYGAGATASRLVSGTLPLHEELESVIAAHKGYASALVFGTGYMANVGTIPQLVGRNDLVIADKLVHASIIDAVALSRAKLERFKHNSTSDLERLLEKQSDFAGRILVVTESVFSMDGDIAPLAKIAQLTDRFGVMLMVDEAHSAGVFGVQGAGLVSALKLQDRVHVAMGTLSKAMGGYGGYVAGSDSLRELLVHGSRAFIYTTAPPPAQLGAAIGAFEVLGLDPLLGSHLLRNALFFRSILNAAGLNTLRSQSQIIPVLIGDNERAVAISEALRERGIIASAIRPPTVPAGTARLRLSVTLAHAMDDLERAAHEIVVVCAAHGVGR